MGMARLHLSLHMHISLDRKRVRKIQITST